ncbi:sortase domain-bontaining protein [Euzebya tangerina]|uniref:sortase domain-containing protein n=1 Tax=Euzebya tangerina TaxID=591198 RepID=UPI00196A2D9B|nr:sortase [Euzebya tangerina]
MSDDADQTPDPKPSDIDAELAIMADVVSGGAAEDDPESGSSSEDDPDTEGHPAGAVDRAIEDTPETDQPPEADRPPDAEEAGKVSTVSRAVSWLATGAAVTILVLWGTGTFDVPSIREIVLREDSADPSPSVTATAPLTGAEVTPEQAPPPPPPEVQRGDPSFIEIPAIGVRASVIPLNTMENGELEVPTDFAQTGWWQGGPEPGERGPSVIAGHVDSVNGPAVFFALEELVFDDAITITRGDGSSAVFAVRSTLNVTKEEFPSDLVYGETDDAQLRLITCDGGFDQGSYTGNLIITAELVEERPPPESGAIF